MKTNLNSEVKKNVNERIRILQNALMFTFVSLVGLYMLYYTAIWQDVIFKFTVILVALTGAWCLNHIFPPAKLYEKLIPFNRLSNIQKKVLKYNYLCWQKDRIVPYICALISIACVFIPCVLFDNNHVKFEKVYSNMNAIMLLNYIWRAIMSIIINAFLAFLFTTWFIYYAWQLWRIYLKWSYIIANIQPITAEEFEKIYTKNKKIWILPK